MKLSRWLLAASLSLCAFVGPATVPEAQASIATAASLEGLVKFAHVVALIEPVESKAEWQEGRIVTFTKLKIVERLGGEAPETVWVKTLGGTVGDIGQSVAGEPMFSKGHRQLIFLHRLSEQARPDLHVVVSRAQGAYPLVKERAQWVLRSSPHLGTIIPKPGAKASMVSAQVKLANRPLDEVAPELRTLWSQIHAAKK